MKLIQLSELRFNLPIDLLTLDQMKELQKALAILSYFIGDIDGLYGPKIRNAWAEYKTDIVLGNPGFIGAESISQLQDQLNRITTIGNADYDFSTSDGAKEAIKLECLSQGLDLNSQISYVLATTQWETNQTFSPVKEAYWLDEDWRKNNLKYYPYYGRGYVQLTWKNNYEKYSQILGVDIVNDPDLALKPDLALFILIHGFKNGTFTCRKITDYINKNETDFIKARRCVNGRDHANDIAQIAQSFLDTLN